MKTNECGEPAQPDTCVAEANMLTVKKNDENECDAQGDQQKDSHSTIYTQKLEHLERSGRSLGRWPRGMDCTAVTTDCEADMPSPNSQGRAM